MYVYIYIYGCRTLTESRWVRRGLNSIWILVWAGLGRAGQLSHLLVDLCWDPKLTSINFVLELERPESSRAPSLKGPFGPHRFNGPLGPHLLKGPFGPHPLKNPFGPHPFKGPFRPHPLKNPFGPRPLKSSFGHHPSNGVFWGPYL